MPLPEKIHLLLCDLINEFRFHSRGLVFECDHIKSAQGGLERTAFLAGEKAKKKMGSKDTIGRFGFTAGVHKLNEIRSDFALYYLPT